jgi:hypothetical protein
VHFLLAVNLQVRPHRLALIASHLDSTLKHVMPMSSEKRFIFFLLCARMTMLLILQVRGHPDAYNVVFYRFIQELILS